MAHHEFPAWRYNEANPKGRIFNSADEIPAKEGWVDHPSKIKPAEAAPAAPSRRDAAKAAASAATDAATAKAAKGSKAKADEPKEVEKPVFDRAAAIKALEDAGFAVDPDTSDAEIETALKGLEKDGDGE